MMMPNFKFCTRNKGFLLHLMGCEEVGLLLKCPFPFVNTSDLFWVCAEIWGLINHHCRPCASMYGKQCDFFSLPLWGVGEEERSCSVGPKGANCSS